MATRTKGPVERTAQGDETGQRRAPLSPDLLKRLYRSMIMSRMVEDQARLLLGKDVPACVASPGLEATQVGAAIDLHQDDMLAPSLRNFAAHVVKGVPLKYVYARVRQRIAGLEKAESRGLPSNVLSPSTISAQLNIGTGVALAYRMQNKPNIVMALSDDTSACLELWHEAMSFAGRNRLPIVFVIENNLWAQSAGAGDPRDVDGLSRTAQAYGFPVMTVDGNDAVAVYRVCYEARERARQGYGPTLVESRTWRWHGEGDPVQHCSPEEVQRWESLDPIPAMERYLRKQKLWDDRWSRQFVKEIKTEIRQALAFARKALPSLSQEPQQSLYCL